MPQSVNNIDRSKWSFPPIVHLLKKHINLLVNVAILFAFIIPFLILYCLYPESFEATWKGRTFYLFFLWLVLLELVLSWEKFMQKNLGKLRSAKSLALSVVLAFPTVYVVVVNFLGLDLVIVEWGRRFGVPWLHDWPLSIEYLVFTVLFAVLVGLTYGNEGLKDFSISSFFLGAVGMIYMTDTLYPFGHFRPLQAFVPFTASLASQILNWMDYPTFLMGEDEGMPEYAVIDSSGRILADYHIAWPCAGVQSLLIYTFTILIFLKKTTIPLLHRIAYFTFGAVITYIINIFRIVSIFIIRINQGETAANIFHNYYGELYSMTWIIAYPLIIIGSRMLWMKLSRSRSGKIDVQFT